MSLRSPDSSSELDGARFDDRQLSNVLLGAQRAAAGFQEPTDVFFGVHRALPGCRGSLELDYPAAGSSVGVLGNPEASESSGLQYSVREPRA